MKRFITYLYECKRGNKSKNVGFIRVNVRGEETTMEVYVRNLVRNMDEGKIYVITYKEKMVGIELGKIKVINGQSDMQIVLQTNNIMESNFTINDIEGVGLQLDSGTYIASCWKDDYAEEIVRGEFKVQNQFVEEDEVSGMEISLVAAEDDRVVDTESYFDMESTPVSNNLNNLGSEEPSITYEKIDLSQIRDLPSPNWHLATNSFLVHGFWNYGYLVLKKNLEEGKKRFSLGVPGIYERPEAVMAVLFGFPNFEAVPQEMVTVQIERNQEAADGTFGCWFVNLKM